MKKKQWKKKTSSIYLVVGHTSFYGKMDWPNLEWYLEDRTPGSDPLKSGLSKWNVVEVDLKKNSQRYTTHV